jgi:uncharacterized protein
MPPRPPAHVDPRSPFVLDTRELGRRPGSMLEVHRDVLAPPGWELELVKVPAGAAVELDVRLESVVDGVLVSVALQAPLSAECGRCLDPVSSQLDLSLAELYVYEPDTADDEVPFVDGDYVDLEPLLRDAIVLALPFNPLCDEDCPGLCVTCGERLADVESDHGHDDLDPRWAALAPLTAQNSPSSATMDPTDESAQSSAPSAPPMREK